LSADPKSPAVAPSARGGSGDKLLERVSRVLTTVADLSAPAPDQDFDALGIDSLTRLELLAILEKEFDIEISEDFLVEFRTINRVVQVVRGRLGTSMRDGD
jgi:acyl carrier protein